MHRAKMVGWAGKTVTPAEDSMPHDMVGRRPGTLRYGNVHAAGKNQPAAAKTVTAAEDFMPHDMGGWAGLVTPRVARGEFFIFPYRG